MSLSAEHRPLKTLAAALSEGRSFYPLDDPQKLPTTWCTDGKKRHDGRNLNDLAPVFFALDSQPGADGSAIFRSGKNLVSVGIMGPFLRSLRPSYSHQAEYANGTSVTILVPGLNEASLECTVRTPSASTIHHPISVEKYLPSSRTAINLTNEEAWANECQLQAIAENIIEVARCAIRTSSYSGAVFTIQATILDYDTIDSAFVAACNALSLALLKSGIEMQDYIAAAVSYVVDIPGNRPVVCVDLDGKEMSMLRQQSARFTKCVLVRAINQRSLAYIDVQGPHLHEPYDQELQNVAVIACETLSKEFVACLCENAAS